MAANVPKTMEALVELPGVGRKTANVVLGHALGVPGLPVDRHVLRVANRIGIARSEDPEVVEQQLGRAMPPAEWTRVSDTLILHGRRICKPKPLCDRCVVRDDCNYYRALAAGSGRALKEGPPPVTRERFSQLVEAALDQIPAAFPRGDEERRRHRRGRTGAARPRRDGDRAARFAVRAVSRHASTGARMGVRQRAARSYFDLPAADRGVV